MVKSEIVIDKLTKRFEDVIAIDGLSFNVAKAELFGLLGPNGAGKTTIINILCGLTQASSGLVLVSGYDVRREMTQVKKLIGVCPQETPAYTYLTGRENIDLFGNLYEMPKEKLKERSEKLLQILGLSEAADRRVGKYSGGMKRRLNLIMALIHNPEIAFLDEPTVALDPQARHAVWEFIKG